jgi:outer membrane protein insertion porin family
LNYFNPEKLNQQITPENDSVVNIKYIVEERSSDQFNASIGYSGSFGITGSLGLTFNNFDISAPFRGGAGQILNFNWSFGTGGTFRTFELGFQEPWLFNQPTQFGFRIFDTRQNYDNLDLKERGASVNIGRRFKFPDDYFRGDWTLKFQETDVLDGDDFYQEGKRNQFSITQVISRSTVFEPLFPASGTRISNSTELSGGPFLPGNTDFVKNIFSAEAFTPLTRDRKLVLYNNFVFSFINSFANDKYVPPNEVFFMGGNGLTYNTQALRGYDDRSVGPVNQFGSPIGGLVAAKYGLELRYSLSMDPLPIFLLTFIEAGNVWSRIDKTDPFDLRRSVGIGTRLMLPAVGIVGFDFAYGFDRKIVDGEDPKWLFHFQFGRGF